MGTGKAERKYGRVEEEKNKKLEEEKNKKLEKEKSRSVTAVLLMAGSGKRMNTEEKKQFIPFCGKPLFYTSVEKFLSWSLCERFFLLWVQMIWKLWKKWYSGMAGEKKRRFPL